MLVPVRLGRRRLVLVRLRHPRRHRLGRRVWLERLGGAAQLSGDAPAARRSLPALLIVCAMARDVVRRSGAVPVVSTIALALGAAALGAVAIGALAIGRLAIGRVTIKKARFESLEVDELTVRRLHVLEQQAPKSQQGGG